MRDVGDSKRYREAASDVARWLEHVAVKKDSGALAWPIGPGVWEDDGLSLGWGGLGPPLFFVDAYLTLGDRSHLELAERAAPNMGAALDQAGAHAATGLFTGLAGFAVVFHELYHATSNDAYAQDVDRVFQLLAGRSASVGDGVHWDEITEILWGTAGIGCTFLDISDHVGDEAVHLATRAGDWLLSEAELADEGVRWSLGEGPIREWPWAKDLRFPNFAHGTAGIGFYLAMLARVTGEERFLDAAIDAARWVFTTCKTDGDVCMARHHDPSELDYRMEVGPARDPDDTSPIYTFGWCHGPPGLGWFFRELQLATGDDSWALWIDRTARAISTSGIPKQLEPGFWDNFGRCCGSASVVEYFLDLHSWRKHPDDLAFALTMADDMLDRATADKHGMRWSNLEFREDPAVLPAQTTFFQGASGIGLTLLRLARHLDGDMRVMRLPHEATWT